MFPKFKCTHYTRCNHQHLPRTFPIDVSNDLLQLSIHPANRPWQQCWYCLQIQIFYPKDVLSHFETTTNHIGWDQESREDVPTPLCPSVEPDSAHQLWRWGVALYWSKITPLSRSSCPKYSPYLFLQECTVPLAIDRLTNSYGMAKHKSIPAEELDVHVFQITLTAQVNFLPAWRLGKPVSVSSSQLRVKWVNPWFVNR
jgi:hypothetical protein